MSGAHNSFVCGQLDQRFCNSIPKDAHMFLFYINQNCIGGRTRKSDRSGFDRGMEI